MDQLLWHLSTAGGGELLDVVWQPLLICLALYYSAYTGVFARAMWHSAGRVRTVPPLSPQAAPPALVCLPTLLRARRHLEGLKRAIDSVTGNGYPGRLVVCAAIDGADEAPQLVREIEAWVARHRSRPRVTVIVAASRARQGKAMAVHTAITHVQDRVARGELDAMPALFFNMDADSELGERALERMAARIQRRGRVFRRRPMIVAANVRVKKRCYWTGWRGLFTMRGQLALQVAREYMTSISLARNNFGLIPTCGVSGALYCTWTEIVLESPRYAEYARRLRFSDLVRWWLGGGPPPLDERVAPNPHAMIGPGDDTIATLVAMSARWRGERIAMAPPASPVHALWDMISQYLSRPVAYDPAAHVYTATPTTVRALFKQRVRWNSSRIWLIQRLGWAPWFVWSVGSVFYLSVALVAALYAVVCAGLILWPFTSRPADWLAVAVVLYAAFTLVRFAGTLLAMIQDHDVRGQWQKLLAVPLAGVYHVVFNLAAGAVGIIQDVVLFGVNTGFAPEETLERAGTGRIAIAYRMRRAMLLAWRSARHGDVPLGWFWIGWWDTPWTPGGYRGWTDRDRAEPPVRARRDRATWLSE